MVRGEMLPPGIVKAGRGPGWIVSWMKLPRAMRGNRTLAESFHDDERAGLLACFACDQGAARASRPKAAVRHNDRHDDSMRNTFDSRRLRRF